MADIQVTVQLNDRASRQLRNIDKAASSLSTTLKTAGAAAAAFATGNIARGIASQYSAFERYRSVLTTYLGTQQKANAELKRLQGLANSLPQDLADVTEAFTVLQRNGIDTSSKSLTAFSNIATANGKSFTQLAEAVADALTGEFERLKEFGIKVSRENDQFVARIGEQQVAVSNSSTDLVRQLQTLGQEGGRFGKAAADNADTLNQSYSNLQGALFEASVTIMENLKPALKDAVDSTAELLRNNKELQKSLGVGIGEAIKTTASATKLLADNIDLIRNAALSYLALRFGNAFVNLSTKISSAVKASQSLSGMFGTMLTVVGRAVPLWGTLAVVIGTAIGYLYSLRDSIVEVNGVTGTLGEYFRAAFQLMGEYVQTFASYIKQTLFGGFFDRIDNRIKEMKEWFAWGFDIIGGYARTAANFLANSFVAAGETIIAVARNIPEFFGAAFDAVIIAAGDLVKAMAQKFTNLKQALQLALSGDFAAAAAKAGEDAGYRFTESFANAFSDLPSLTQGVDYGEIFGTDRIGRGMDILSEKAGALRTEINAYLSPAMERLTGKVLENRKANEQLSKQTKYYDDAIIRASRSQKNLNKGLGETNDKMTNLAETTTPKAAVAIENLFNPIEKIKNGLDSTIGRVSDTFADVLLGMKDGFKSLEDIALDTLKMIISTLIEAFIRSKLLGQSLGGLGGLGGGGAGGLIGGLFSSLGGLGASTLIPGFGLLAGAGMLLGGLFADGGNTARAGQKPILVGERGPEIFMPGKAGQVVSNEELNSMGGQGDLNVSFTINAIDTQTGVEFLLENKRVITGVIQEAYMRRGTSGPLG